MHVQLRRVSGELVAQTGQLRIQSRPLARSLPSAAEPAGRRASRAQRRGRFAPAISSPGRRRLAPVTAASVWVGGARATADVVSAGTAHGEREGRRPEPTIANAAQTVPRRPHSRAPGAGDAAVAAGDRWLALTGLASVRGSRAGGRPAMLSPVIALSGRYG